MSETLLVATRKGLFTVARTGQGSGGWSITRHDFLADNVSMVLHDPRDGSTYAALDHGHFGAKMHRKDPNGSDWQECAAPAYPEKPEGEPEKDQWGKEIPWSTVRIWALETGGPDEPGVIWCGTIPGGLFRSRDRGVSWDLIDALWYEPKRKAWFGGGADLPGIHSICVDPRDSRHVRVGVSCGGIWTTPDGGTTWRCEAEGMRAAYLPPELQGDPNGQDPHRLVQCPSAPDRLYVQHHNGIFHSGDGGRRWQEIKDVPVSSFGFAVAVHPHDPDTAWFIPAINDERRIPQKGQIVVTRTRDGGGTFDELRHNLPQEHAYDIVYRHGLDVDASGDRLAMGSTTGGLWVSEDQGDRWHCVGEHLPPVYAVRFVNS